MDAYNDFTGEPSVCELYARFAYHLIACDYSRHPQNYSDPSDGIAHLRQRIKAVDDLVLDTFLCAYQYLVGRGITMRFARTAMIERARKGLDFRSVVFVDYKAQRRRPPRVTNRGGSTRATKVVHE